MSKEREAANKPPLKYTEVPDHYVWDTKHCTWKERQWRAKGGEVIGRMCQCSPKNPDLYALRLLLLHVSGVKSFSELKTVDGEEKRSVRPPELED